MVLFNPLSLWRHLAPAWLATTKTLPAYRTSLLRIGVFSGLAVALETAGLSLIYVLILNFTGGDPTEKVGLEFLAQFAQSPLVVAFTIVALITLGIQFKYRIVKETARVADEAGSYAGKLALRHARGLILDSDLQLRDPRDLSKVLRVMLKDIPFACGFVAGGMSRLLVHVLQALVIAVILLYLSPLLTLTFIVLAFAAVTLLSRSLTEVESVGQKRNDNMVAFNIETDEISEHLTGQDADSQAFTARVDKALDSGRAHDHLHLRLSQRRVRQAGPLVISYVYPIAIMCISLMYIYRGDLAPDISEVALYFLLFRQFIISMNAIAMSFMAFSRHYQPLAAFHDLLVLNELPTNVSFDEDDEG